MEHDEGMPFESDQWICSHYGDDYAGQKGSVSTPIYQSSTHIFPSCEEMTAGRGIHRPFTAGDTYFYGRDGNPTVEVLEKKIAALERTSGGICFGSGMAAISAACFYALNSGDHAVVVDEAYGRNFANSILPRHNMEVTIVDGSDVAEIVDAIRPNTKLIYLESPCGMIYQLQNLRAVSELAESKGILTMTDNTWSTPIHQKPHTHGIDLVVHSLSKYIGGHSDLIGGAVTGKWEHMDGLAHLRSSFGSILHPQEAFLALRGLRTLPVRMRLHQSNGMAIAEYLEQHPRVAKVNYPGLESHPQHALAKRQMLGFSSLMSCVIDAPPEKTRIAINHLRLFKLAVSWGGYESLIIEPRGCGKDKQQSCVRLYVGQDNINELKQDLEEALAQL